jgi:hypothetical protein
LLYMVLQTAVDDAPGDSLPWPVTMNHPDGTG